MVRSIKGLAGRLKASVDRLKDKWRSAPLAFVFAAHLAIVLAIATTVTVVLVSLIDEIRWHTMTFEVDAGDGQPALAYVESGPYIYDAKSDELLPATEIDLPGDNPYAVFVAIKSEITPDSLEEPGTIGDSAESSPAVPREVYASMDMVRSGRVRLLDWGLNYTGRPGYTAQDVVDDRGAIAPDKVAEYDAANRVGRVDSVGGFEVAMGVDLRQVYGECAVSNVAYYADVAMPGGVEVLLTLLNVGIPVVAYGGLAIGMFRRFYKVHIEEPLEAMGVAARRIACRDLDFELEPQRGRELGRLSETMEDMRSSLLRTQRELWRTAEERRRLNAAFAHDLRTPVTVLKGTLEMALMRVQGGTAVEEKDLDTLAVQVGRLESYANAMSGLTKLEGRAVDRAPLDAAKALCRLFDYAADLVEAKRPGLPLARTWSMRGSDQAICGGVVCGDISGAVSLDSLDRVCLMVDISLVEEVVGSVIGNACAHAAGAVGLGIAIEQSLREDGGSCLLLRIEVVDDGEGFSAQALKRACDPFYSESKGPEHFGLGLNISAVLTRLHGGGIEISNRDEGGARVAATFDVSEGVGA